MRFLTWEDPLSVQTPKTGALTIPPASKAAKIAISVTQYVFVAAVVVVNLYTAWTLGANAVLAWSCGWSYWPTLWVMLGIVPHILAVLSFYFSIELPEDSKARPQAFSNRICSLFQSECTPTACSESKIPKVEIGFGALLLQYIGAITAIMHLILGAALFSSLTYIGYYATLSVFGRFSTAAIASRLILHFETSGLIDRERIKIGFPGELYSLTAMVNQSTSKL